MTTASASICKTVLKAVSETFETMIFTQVAPLGPAGNELPADDKGAFAAIPEQSAPGSLQKNYWTAIPILSPLKGSMLMEIPDPLAIELTKNLYGWVDDSQITEKVKQDALTELINTISGRLMRLLLPEDQTFELGLPELKDGPRELCPEDVVCRFAAAEQNFSFILTDELGAMDTRLKTKD